MLKHVKYVPTRYKTQIIKVIDSDFPGYRQKQKEKTKLKTKPTKTVENLTERKHTQTTRN